MSATNETRGVAAAAAVGRPIPILMYHHIAAAPAEQIPSRYLFVSPDRFRRQMRALKRLGYTGCSIGRLKPYLLGERTGKVVGITFDDGYRNVYEAALPILEECGFTATTYFVSRQIGGCNGWDSGWMPYAPCMDLKELREWSARGQEVGGHTLDHTRLAAVSEPEAREQIAGCKRALEDMTGTAVDAFSYPYGSCSPAVVEIAREAGYATATTTRRDRVRARDDLLQLPRLTIRGSDRLLSFLWKSLA